MVKQIAFEVLVLIKKETVGWDIEHPGLTVEFLEDCIVVIANKMASVMVPQSWDNGRN